MNMQTAQIESISNGDALFRTGRILSESGTNYCLDDQGLQVFAVAAFSCLVKPQPGDTVLYASTADGENVIVSIVNREGDQNLAVEFPRDASFQSRNGAITIAAQRSISMTSPKLNMLSETLVQKSDEAYFQMQEMHADGEKLNANFDNIAILSKFISTMAGQVINKFSNYFRHSQDFDQVKAANMTRTTGGLYALNSRQTVMLSKKDTRIDAERIHIG